MGDLIDFATAAAKQLSKRLYLEADAYRAQGDEGSVASVCEIARAYDEISGLCTGLPDPDAY